MPRPTRRELAIWEQEWRRPQAVMWEAYGWFDQVANYVRARKIAESPKASVSARRLILAMEDTLGISIGGLQRNRWIIAAGDPPAAEDDPAKPSAPRGGRARARLEVLNGGA